MSNIGSPTDDGGNDEVLAAMSDVIESEQANIQIEIMFNKAARVGTMLKIWRAMMMSEVHGAAFPADWVDHATMDIFHQFFPPTIEEVAYYASEDNDD